MCGFVLYPVDCLLCSKKQRQYDSGSFSALSAHPHRMNYPWMCGSGMGMVFCPANYAANDGAGFSLIFKSWVINDSHSYAIACLGVFTLGVVRQLLAYLRGNLPALHVRRITSSGEINQPFIPADPAASGGFRGFFARNPPVVLLAVDTLLFALSLFIAYINMLVAMAYDAGLLSSLVAGEASAYFCTRATGLIFACTSTSKTEVGEPCCA